MTEPPSTAFDQLDPAARPAAVRRVAACSIVAALILLTGCRAVSQPMVRLPSRHSVESDRFTIFSDVYLDRDHWLIRDLVRLERQVVESLELPEPKREVIVHVFSNRREYLDFLEATYPQLPSRRAYFFATPERLTVYTFWGDRIQEDLRHEFTHGLLHSCLGDVPLWIDEGLAEYFEVVGPLPGGINVEYADRLSAASVHGWRPDLERLEAIDEVAGMQRVDYEQAWAWIHFMLHGPAGTRRELLDYLDDLRTNPDPERLSTRLARRHGDIEGQLGVYIRSLAKFRRG